VTENKKKLLESLAIDRAEPVDRPGGGRRVLPVIAILAALAAAAGLYLWLGPKPSSSKPEPVSVATPQAANAAAPGASQPAASRGSVLSGSGYVVARRQATISAEIIGRISEVLIEEGMRVEAGQVVARLDSRLVRIDLEVQEANARAAEAMAAEAERTLKRRRGLVKGDVVSEAQLSEAEANAASARAQADLAEAQAERQRALLEKHEIRAPFAGVVTTKDAQPGEIVSPSAAGGGFTRTGICTVVDMDSLEIEVDVNEAFISRVSAGQAVRATLDAYPDWEIPASVIAIIPTADRSRATVRVRIKIESKDPRILPEMAAKVQFLDVQRNPNEGPRE
jgi:HlyD family secretion protein